MNYKISLAALAVAATVSGQAMAGDSADAVNALIALGATITPAGYAGLDGDVSTDTTVWSTVADDTAACALGGVLCSGTDITKLELPDAGFTPAGGLPSVLTALDPIKDTLINLNFSNDLAAPDNVLAGGFAGLDGYTALEQLALNNNGAAGTFPDLSNSTAMNWINIADNPNITGMTGKLAGGSDITFLSTNNNVDMVGDLSSTLTNISTTSDATVNLDDTKLSGVYTYKVGDSASVVNSDIIVANDPGTVGYTASAVVQPASGVTVTGGEESATISWADGATGAQTGYSVSYTSDDGVTLQGTTLAIAPGTQAHSFSNVTAGTYKAVVQSTGPNDRAAAPALSADFVVTAPVTVTPPTCVLPQVLNSAQTACVDPVVEPAPVSSGGGGAALWLVMLPLMGLFRRKRA